jgi:hypothetical protein
MTCVLSCGNVSESKTRRWHDNEKEIMIEDKGSDGNGR